MCLTAHFIDDEWKLQKRILNFCPITGHKSDDLGKWVEKCLLDWGMTRYLPSQLIMSRQMMVQLHI